MAGGDEQGAWEVRARHRSGSLETIVARSRRRNLAISLGVLGLLAASLVLALAAAQRQQRLARQQMEFVAAVSHELRTPLAVICSAGENLADGVVADGAQVKRYGALIQTEGRRLGDMVERVMEFAGISSGTAVRALADVDISKVVAEAADALRRDARRSRGHAERARQWRAACGDRRCRTRCDRPCRTSSATRSSTARAARPSTSARRCTMASRRACRFASPTAGWASTPPICRTSSSRSIAGGGRSTRRSAGPASA